MLLMDNKVHRECSAEEVLHKIMQMQSYWAYSLTLNQKATGYD